MKVKTLLVMLLIVLKSSVFAQVKLILHPVHLLGNEKIAPKKEYKKQDGETYTISHLKYYLSVEGSMPRLIDAFQTDTIEVSLPTGHYDSLAFFLGIDSTVLMQGVYEGDLDPIKGMFWTWTTGFINFKLEGFSEQSSIPIKKYEYHIGGYSGNQKTQQAFTLALPEKSKLKEGSVKDLRLEFSLDSFWKQNPQLSFSKTPAVAQPGPAAVKISQTLPAAFKLKSYEP